jgi:pyridoxine/pyridoxamine 5'-phosphate oxidase
MSLAVNEHPWGVGSPVLADLESICWQMLYDAATNRKNAMHQAVIATAVDGVAHMRTVVLRRVDAGSKKIYLHTDLRSKKMVDLKKTGHLSWLVYDQSQRTQIRLSGKVIIHHMDHLCKEHWNKTGHHSRRYYMLDRTVDELAEASTGLTEALTEFAYTLEESEVGFKHFVVVETVIDWMEWYYTHSKGNRRARFTYDNAMVSSATWLMS